MFTTEVPAGIVMPQYINHCIYFECIGTQSVSHSFQEEKDDKKYYDEDQVMLLQEKVESIQKQLEKEKELHEKEKQYHEQVIKEYEEDIQNIKNESETFQSMYTHYLLLINDLFL